MRSDTIPAMSERAKRRMTAEEFVAWAMQQPEGQRYELVDGEAVGMASERLAHARAKVYAMNALDRAAKAAGLVCEALPDGMALRVDTHLVYDPDAMLRCGPPLPGDIVLVEDPVIVVEVLSPSTRSVDINDKLAGYFRVPSLHHYLILNPANRVAIHHLRGENGAITTRIVQDGPLRLDPPGIVLENLFAPP
jgi:Uma2 family endonuclease